MNILILILLCIIGLIAILLILALFVKQDYSLEREIKILKSKHEVFDYIKYLKNQDNYSKWATMDPEMEKKYIGTDATIGFVSAWESKKKDVGQGEQEIIKIREDERIDFEIRFIKPFKSIAAAYMTTETITDKQTTVKWGFKSKFKYPMNLMLLFMKMDDLVGKDFETGLFRLKEILERQ
ncbi:MAG: SRPBCC family protein [Bacteroidales bacterium]